MWSDLRIRLSSLFRRGRAEGQLDDELRFHLEQAEERNLARGMDAAEARRQARIELGGFEQIKEECRDARGVTLVENLARDVRHAARRLTRDWRFSVAAVVVLTLGIGANTAIFSVVNAALFREQPFVEPERLVHLYQNVGIHGGGEAGTPEATSYPAYRDMAAFTDLFSGVTAATIPFPVRYQTGEGLRPALAELATANYLEVLGLRPALGRWLDPREDEPGAEPVAVVNHQTWRKRFGADPDLVGRTLRINGQPVTIVGVGPRGFHASMPAGIVTDLWLSISSAPAVFGGPPVLERGAGMFLVKARLRDGVEVPRVRAVKPGNSP